MTAETLPWARHLRRSLESLTVYDVPPAGPDQARMHANECPEPWPEQVRAELGRVVASIELNRYPDTSGRDLRATLGERHGVDPERVVLGNGSDEIISLLLTALSNPDRPGVLVTPAPTFVMYAHCARVLDYEVREVVLDADLELDVEGMRAALGGATVCFLARPNNPTSSLWDADTIRSLVADHADVVFVIDEAYAAYSPRASLFDPDAPSNVVHMSTLSKVGMAALRVGYCIAHPELALALNKVRHPYNISATSLALAEVVLRRFGDVQDAMITRAIANRSRLERLIDRIPNAHRYPAHGNLVLVRLDPPDRASGLAAALAERGVLVKDVSRTAGLEGCLRVSVGTSDELDRFEAALAAAVG